MKTLETIVTAPVGTTSDEAYTLMRKNRVKKLPVIEKDHTFRGMYVWNDVRSDEQKREKFSIDKEGHFLVGAAIGLAENDMERVDLLVEVFSLIFFLECLFSKLEINFKK